MSRYQERIESFTGYCVCDDCKTPTEEQLQAVEREIGAVLPADYREFLTHYGGYAAYSGSLSSRILKAFPGADFIGEEVPVNVFLGIKEDSSGAYDLLSTYYCFRERMPFNFLPIAIDLLGNMICLAVSGEDQGSVYYWDRECEEDVDEGEEPGYSNVYLLAISFDEFINMLQFEREEE
ncbi:SMI1/KNR4 family protein [Cyanobacteria bacterium FACHB-DQ100]|nr:SMI1/KNR4 family protein [Cyanobacteria bacterium FACHB-DQ100]